MVNPLKKLSKIPIRFILLGLIVVLTLGFYISPFNQKKMVEYIKPQRQDIKAVISTSGTLTGRDSLELKFKLSGRISEIYVEEGDFVEAGQTLASLEHIIQLASLNQAQNTLREKQATLDKVLDDIHLFQYGNGGFSNIGTANETQTQRQSRTVAEVLKDNAFDQLKLAQNAFLDTLIISPIQGVITQVNFSPLQNVSSIDSVFRVVDFKNPYFDSEVDESDIAKIKIDMKAEIKLNAYPDEAFSGSVDQILPFTQTSENGAEVIIVRIKINNDNLPSIDGLKGQADFILESKTNVLVIPQSSIKDDFVFVKRGNKNVKVKIKKGLETEDNVEILDGINEYDQIVKDPD